MQLDLTEFYRQTKPEELAFYTEMLYPLQDRVFRVASVYGNAKILSTFSTSVAHSILISCSHWLTTNVHLWRMRTC